VVMDKNNGKTILDVIGLGGSFVPAEEDEEKESGEEGEDAPPAGRVV
jgi:hypothetical protein